MYHIVKIFQRVKARNREGPGWEGLGVLNYKILVKNSEEACAGEEGWVFGVERGWMLFLLLLLLLLLFYVFCDGVFFFFFLCINSFFFSFFLLPSQLREFLFLFFTQSEPSPRERERERGRDQTPFFLFPLPSSLQILLHHPSFLPSFPPPPQKKNSSSSSSSRGK